MNFRRVVVLEGLGLERDFRNSFVARTSPGLLRDERPVRKVRKRVELVRVGPVPDFLDRLRSLPRTDFRFRGLPFERGGRRATSRGPATGSEVFLEINFRNKNCQNNIGNKK